MTLTGLAVAPAQTGAPSGSGRTARRTATPEGAVAGAGCTRAGAGRSRTGGSGRGSLGARRRSLRRGLRRARGVRREGMRGVGSEGRSWCVCLRVVCMVVSGSEHFYGVQSGMLYLYLVRLGLRVP